MPHVLLVIALIAALLMVCPLAAHAADHVAIENTPNGCAIRRYTVHSDAMKRNIKVAVVLPPAYEAEPDRKFPVLFALHGMNAPWDTWTHMSTLHKELTRCPMLVVTFDGDKAGWYIDATKKPDSQFEAFFFDTLMPHFDKAYRTNGQKAVTGFSMGGYGAMHYMLSKPDAFVSASSLSSALDYFDRDDHAFKKLADALEALVGPKAENARKYAACSVPLALKKAGADGATLPPMLFTCGTEDGSIRELKTVIDSMVESNQASITKAKDAGEKEPAHAFDFEMRIAPGGHNWAYWKKTAPQIIDFHWRHFAAAAK